MVHVLNADGVLSQGTGITVAQEVFNITFATIKRIGLVDSGDLSNPLQDSSNALSV